MSRSTPRYFTRTEFLFALPAVALIIVLYYTWFALRDRYLIFLYFHDMGPGFDTTPFGAVTASRYWMTGFVAGGAVLVPYLAANFLLARLYAAFRPPRPLHLWLLCAAPLLIAIPAIVLTVNDPVLPLANTAQVTVAALAALALALALGPLVARRPLTAFLAFGDGLGLAILLFALNALQFYPRFAGGSRAAAYLVFQIGSLAVALVLLLFMTVPHILLRNRLPRPHALPPFVAGLTIAYLFLPLCHHLFFSTDQGTFLDAAYFSYIPDAANYFAASPLLQLAIWLVTALFAVALSRMRVWLVRHLARRSQKVPVPGART